MEGQKHYTVQSTEKQRSSSSSFETKALLYLAGMHEDSHKMEFFIVDFYNDLTSTNSDSDIVWDLQSKASKKHSAREVGKALVTLYKNYVSNFDFHHFILFMGGVTRRNLINPNAKNFGVDNYTIEARESIANALMEECRNKKYVSELFISKDKIEKFLSKVNFIIDEYDEIQHVKSIVKMNTSIFPENDKFKKIFEYIRKEQSAKKEGRCVEGEKLNEFKDYLKYDRHIRSSELRLVVVNNILGYNLPDGDIPVAFNKYLKDMDENEIEDCIDECKNKIVLTMFDNTNTSNFWKFFEKLCSSIVKNPEFTVDKIYELICDYLDKLPHLDSMSAKYFIAMAKKGLSVY